MLPEAGIGYQIDRQVDCCVTIFVNGYQEEVAIKSGSWLILMEVRAELMTAGMTSPARCSAAPNRHVRADSIAKRRSNRLLPRETENLMRRFSLLTVLLRSPIPRLQ